MFALGLGDEFAALAAFLVDALLVMLGAGLFAARHHGAAVGMLGNAVGRDDQSAGGLAQGGEQHRAVGAGGVDVSGGGGQQQGALGELMFAPATRSAVRRFRQVMGATARSTLDDPALTSQGD